MPKPLPRFPKIPSPARGGGLGRGLRLLTLLILLMLLASSAFARSANLEDDSGWISYNGKEYKLAHWYNTQYNGFSVMGYSSVRSVLIDKKDQVFAMAPTGFRTSALCFSFEYCWSFVYRGFGVIPAIWQLAPKQLSQSALSMELAPTDPEGPPNMYLWPEDEAIGFTRSYNPLLYPVAWASFILKNFSDFLGILSITAMVFACFYAAKWAFFRKTVGVVRKVLKGLFILTLTLLILFLSMALALVGLMGTLGSLIIVSVATCLLLMRFYKRRRTAKDKT